MNIAVSIFLSMAKRYWKHLLIAAGIIFAVVFIRNKYVDFKNELIQQGFNTGYQSAATKFGLRVEKARQENTALEIELDKATDDYVKIKDEADRARKSKEGVLASRIEDRMAKIPDDLNHACAIPPDVFEARNAIRALGPNARK